MKKLKCKPILLESSTGTLVLGKEINWDIPGTFRGTKFHLYLASDEEIQISDYYTRISLSSNEIGKATNLLKDPYSKKVAATTDTSLNLPFIPKSFIKEYVEKNGNIDEVMIELETSSCAWPVSGFIPTTKVKIQKDNTVIVSTYPVKEFWTFEEHVIDMQYYMEYCQENSYVTPHIWLSNHKHY